MESRISLVRSRKPERRVSVPSLPFAVEVDLARTAILIIDMQNDFAHEDGWFGARGVPTAQAVALVPQINALTATLRAHEVPIVWLNWGVRADLADLPDMLLARGAQYAGRATYGDRSPTGNGRILVADEWGAQLLSDLKTEARDLHVSKVRFSGFAHTTLDTILRKMDVTTLLFAGVNTDRCVFATLQDAGSLGYDCVLLSDVTATSSDQTATAVIHDLVMRLYGVVASSADLLSALPSPSTEVNS